MSKITPQTAEKQLEKTQLFSKGDIYRHYHVTPKETTVTRGIITSYTGHAMTPYEIRALNGPHSGTRIQVSHDLISSRTAHPTEINTEEQAFNNSITWKLFNETGDTYQKAYNRKPVLNAQTREVELDRIYEDTDTETVTLTSAITNREFTKPAKGTKINTNESFEVHIQNTTRGRSKTRFSQATNRDHAPERIAVIVSTKTSKKCDREKRFAPDTIKAAFAVHCVFDLAQTENVDGQIWVPGRAIPGAGSGDAGVG